MLIQSARNILCGMRQNFTELNSVEKCCHEADTALTRLLRA